MATKATTEPKEKAEILLYNISPNERKRNAGLTSAPYSRIFKRTRPLE